MNKQLPLAVIVLAAGKGTRMKSSKAKVLHEVFFEPMVHHVLKAVQPLSADTTIVIVGHQKAAVEQCLSGHGVLCAEQKEQRGTGHAVLCAELFLEEFQGNIMILCGDSPLLRSSHLEEMLMQHSSKKAFLTIMSTTLENPTNYGRIISDQSGSVREIIEEKDATEEQRTIKEINAGIYCAEKEFLFETLKFITDDNSQGEMYLTDIVSIAVKSGFRVEKYEHPHPSDVLGVNSRVELAEAHVTLQARRNKALMTSGITIKNSSTVAVSPTSTLAPDCILGPQITISGTCLIGSDCVIESGVFLTDVTLGSGVRIGANSVLSGCSLADGTIVAPLSFIDETAAS